jgi:hypothetical protein
MDLPAPARWAIWTLVVAALVTLFVFFRLNYQTRVINGDDWIVLGVSHGMAERGDLDTNWAVNPVPKEFRYPQYNFSAYNLVGHAILTVVGRPEIEIPVLRAANLAFQGLAALLLALALRNARAPPWGVALGVLLFVVAPGPVHDAHMLRAESLLYLLFAVVVWAATSPRPLLLRVAAAGLAIGFGAASKVTFLAAGLVMAPLVLIEVWRTPRWGVLLMLAAGVSAAAGFAAGAPHALANPDAFLEGMKVLNAQYSHGQPPHSLVDYSPWAQALWIGSFFVILYGPLLPAGLAGVGLARLPPWAFGLWLSAAATALWSVSEKTFFERNLALAVVAACVLLGWLSARRPRTAAAIGLVSLVPMLWWSWHILYETLDHDLRRTAWERAQGLQVAKYVYVFDPPPADISRCDGVFGVRHFGDGWTERGLATLDARGERRMARYEGRFHLVPVSTLQNFLDRDVIYYACR